MNPSSLLQIRDEAHRQHRAGNLPAALALHREALRIAPRAAGIWLSTGLLLNEMGDQPASLDCFESAVEIDPALFPAVEAARRICVAAGLLDKADRYTRLALALRPSDDMRLARALTIGAIADSVDAIRATRRSYEAGLDEALASGLQAQDIGAAQGLGAFFLAYHGEDDSRLQAKAARLLLAAAPGVAMTAPHCNAGTRRPGRIRVGFISAFLCDHSIGNTTRGLVAELSRDRFEVHVLRITPSRRDAITEAIKAAADHALDLDADDRVAREQIAALELDVLFFQDIGMEPVSYRLAFARLAPVQCVSFGHPNTTGIPNVDYFVSNDLYETPQSAAHYTEMLFLLHDLPTLAYYYRPTLPPDRSSRADFGIPESRHLYLCAQTLFKLHPDFDGILMQILAGDPDGVVVLIRGQYPEYTQQLQQRLARSLAELSSRVVMLERMPYARYLQLLSVADVCLDTPHFNGMNSSLEALALGTPVVTLPGRFQRGRHTQAMYRKMGLNDAIARDADHYVEIALRLGRDWDHSADFRRRIQARSNVLFEDRRVITEFERFFQTALHAARPNWAWQK